MSNKNNIDSNELRNFLSSEEMEKILPEEILEQLKCPHCNGHLVAQFSMDGKPYKIYTPKCTNNITTCGYCRKVISDIEIKRQAKEIKVK